MPDHDEIAVDAVASALYRHSNGTSHFGPWESLVTRTSDHLRAVVEMYRGRARAAIAAMEHIGSREDPDA